MGLFYIDIKNFARLNSLYDLEPFSFLSLHMI